MFAPAAGRLACGEALHTLGPPATAPILLELPEPTREPSGVAGEVIQVDRFGNLISNIPGEWLGGGAAPAATRESAGTEVRVDGRGVGPVLRTYGDVASGELLALVGSLGLLEVSVRDGSAADRLRGRRGTPITVSWPDPVRPAPTPRDRPPG
ncbi:MAG: hypothetical protein GWM90_19145 [Gemmatimonadetes bacterium]|nr:SAM-dependent chlorinase/fluorinase [Gemmatimonadota bacterium]NIQ56517.1 SAM-dependent chlorinase/fluorinase [Gemmatimonadota bacterium]NIU76717.1 hypothetical protein [Gammaproteobacteria bacterium]NIX46127.1 hypothetical protein [Gemmatimonadota bacterium]NIY10445.1 hypothetical protein [Gemmatimonadota bacterium]